MAPLHSSSHFKLDNYDFLLSSVSVDRIVDDKWRPQSDDRVNLLVNSIEKHGFHNDDAVYVASHLPWKSDSRRGGKLFADVRILDGAARTLALRKLRGRDPSRWRTLCDNLTVTLVIRKDGKAMHDAEMIALQSNVIL